MTVGTLHTMDRSGDTKVIWDSDQPVEVEAAQATFDKLTAAGYQAFNVVGEDGDRGTVMRVFDPSAERIIMVKQLVGG